MKKEYFIEKLEQRKMALETSIEVWNKKAKRFYTRTKESENDSLIEFLKEYVDFRGKSVLDVGFATGKHLKLMADEGANVLAGVEISDEMVRYAKKYFTESGLNTRQIELYNLPWEEVDLDKLNWRDRFDLVVSSRSPALDSYDSIKKLIAASKKGVCFVTHADIKEDLLCKAYKEITGKEYDSKRESFWSLFNILYLDGYYANIKIDEKKGKMEYETDKLVTRYIDRIFPEKPSQADLTKLKEFIKKHELDGRVTINIERKIALIYFEK